LEPQDSEVSVNMMLDGGSDTTRRACQPPGPEWRRKYLGPGWICEHRKENPGMEGHLTGSRGEEMTLEAYSVPKVGDPLPMIPWRKVEWW